MAKQDTPEDADVVTEATPEQTTEPAPILAELAELAAAEPRCPECGSGLRSERRIPDFATHHTLVCDGCGYHQKVQD